MLEDGMGTCEDESVDELPFQPTAFLSCGDLRYDSDRTYAVDVNDSNYLSFFQDDYVSHDPIQPPIDPPYKHALDLKFADFKFLINFHRRHNKLLNSA